MNEPVNKALLPAGLRDALPEEAEREAMAVHSLMNAFRAEGYQTVKPPLMEFEQSLLSGPGGELTQHLFRLMDPISQQMMGLRADITPQIARIAASRLAGSPRPLRLCYSGQVLRVRGDQLRPERQFTQAGIELFGSDAVKADVEIVALDLKRALKADEVDSRQVEQLIDRYQGEWEKLAEELQNLRKIAVEGRQQGEAGMSKEATTFYEHIANEAFEDGVVPQEANAKMKALMEAIVDTLQHSLGSIDFWNNADKQKRTRSEIKTALTLTGISELKSRRERIAVEIMKLAKNRHDALLKTSENQ